MILVPDDYRLHVRKAIASFWRTLGKQGLAGKRQATRAGKQMDGFCKLVRYIILANGLPAKSVFVGRELELPGYFRATKKWDLLVVHEGQLVAAIEFKSMTGSFGKNLNNRAEEALGNAVEVAAALKEGAFGRECLPPWVGSLMCLAEGSSTKRPIRVNEPHFSVFPEFRSSSYEKRLELLFRRLVVEKHYDSAALLFLTKKGARGGVYREPTADLGIGQFLFGLAAHIRRFQLARIESGADDVSSIPQVNPCS
jgi:hypothetical protein